MKTQVKLFVLWCKWIEKTENKNTSTSVTRLPNVSISVFSLDTILSPSFISGFWDEK